MTIQRKALTAKAEMLGERQVRVICSSESVDRSGEIVVQDGIDLSNYLNNPVVLWQHDAREPIGRSIDIGLSAGQLVATVEFAPAGVSAEADKICGLVKAGVINAVSIGFTPMETEPLDKANPKKGPQKYLKSELCELSFVSVPAHAGALVVERQYASADLKVGASRNLELVEDADFAAIDPAATIFEKAGFGGEDRDTTFARKGFLAYDPAAAEDRDAYLIPFARVKGGRLVTSVPALKAAGAQLARMNLPQDVAAKARAVLDHYEAKMTQTSGSAMVTRGAAPVKVKSLYGVARAAYLLADLGYLQSDTAWEAEFEGDGSQVPAMLADACRAFADALLAMTQEEVAELLAAMPTEASEDVTKGLVAKGLVPADARPARVALALAGLTTKAGKKFSASTEKAMREACKQISDGHEALMGLLTPDADADGDDDTDSTSDTDGDAQKDARQARLRKVKMLAVSAS